MGTILENNTQEFSDGDQITSTNLNNLLTEATFKSTAVDQSSVTLVGGKIALPSTIPTRSFTSPTLNSPTVEGTFTVNASALGGTGIVIESEGIASNDNDTSLPTSAAVKDYVDTKITAEDLDFAGDTGTGAVDLDSQTLTIAGTANKIETSASGQTLTLTLPSTVNISTLDAGSIITTSIKAATNNSSRISIKGGNTAGAQIDLDGDTYASNGLATYSGLRHVFKNVAGSSTYAEINSSGVVTNTISEYGVGSGVTVDGLLLKDGGFTAAGTSTFAGQTISNLGTVTTANIDGGSIDGTTVGASSASTGAFTTLSTTGDFTPGGYITITDTTPLIRTSSNSENLTLRGGNTDAGGQIQLNGSTAASANKIFYFANEHEFWNTAVTEKIEFQGNSIYFGSAGDVKLYRSGADALKTDDSLEVVGDFNADSGTLFVDASANRVGIGTSSPGQKLEVNGGNIEIDSTGGVDSRIIFSRGGTNLAWMGIPNWDSDSLYIYGPDAGGTTSEAVFSYTQDNLKLRTNNSDALTIDGSQNVGIGDSTPSCKLDVSSGGVDKVALFKSTDSTAYVELADNTGSVQFITLSSGALRIATGGGAGGGSIGTSGLFIDQSQNVGIGDDTPSYKLDVNGDFRATGALRDSSGDAGTSGQILSSTGTGTNWINASSGGSSPWTTSGSNIYYNTGNVGIGTSAPDKKLVVAGAGSEIIIDDTDATDTPRLRFRESGTTSASIFTDASDLIFDTGTTERVRITSAGNVGIGTTPTGGILLHVGAGSIYQNKTGSGIFPGLSDTTTHGFMAESQGANGSSIHVSRTNNAAGNFARQGLGDVLVFRNTSGSVTEAGSIEITGASSVAYRTSSDYRLKENVVDVVDGIDRLKQLNPVRFNFIGETPLLDGFLAHEVQDIVPEAIGGTKDAVDEDGNPVYQGIDQSKLVPLLTAALQEAVAKIEALEARVAVLEG